MKTSLSWLQLVPSKSNCKGWTISRRRCYFILLKQQCPLQIRRDSFTHKVNDSTEKLHVHRERFQLELVSKCRLWAISNLLEANLAHHRLGSSDMSTLRPSVPQSTHDMPNARWVAHSTRHYSVADGYSLVHHSILKNLSIHIFADKITVIRRAIDGDNELHVVNDVVSNVSIVC